MTNDDTPVSRRKLLGTASTVSLVGLAGCLGAGDNPVVPDAPWEDRDQPLPEGAEECVSIEGIERDPDAVAPKDEVDYQFSPNYTGEDYIEMCANCQFFCTGGQFGTTWGACTEVEGGIRSQDWCALWQPVEFLVERDRSGARR